MESYEPRRPTSPTVNGWLVLALLICGAVLIYRTVIPRATPLLDPDARSKPVTPRGELAADERTTIDIFRKTSPAVVSIRTSKVLNPLDALRLKTWEQPQGTGTGIIWNDDGYVVTNFHVIQNANLALVTFADGTTVNANMVGGDPKRDIAVLKFDPTQQAIAPIEIGDSDTLQVGQKVFAIGSPFGLDQTLTTGVISGLDREIATIADGTIRGAIQTDAAINPGNSGGPLLDSAGLAIGLNTAIVSPSGSSAGIGFAIPITTVDRVVLQIIQQGRVQRAGLGAYIYPDRVVQSLGETGVLIETIPPESAAAKAGLRGTRILEDQKSVILGDLIIAIDGREVTSNEELFSILEPKKPGDRVIVTVKRGTDIREVEVTLQPLD